MILDRSLRDRFFNYGLKNKSHMITSDRLAAGGFFKNNRQMIVVYYWPSFQRLCRVIRSMTDLETLSLLEWKPTLIEDVPQLFRSCPKLTEMHLRLLESSNFEMGEEHKNEVRSCFQSLKIFELEWDIVFRVRPSRKCCRKFGVDKCLKSNIKIGNVNSLTYKQVAQRLCSTDCAGL